MAEKWIRLEKNFDKGWSSGFVVAWLFPFQILADLFQINRPNFFLAKFLGVVSNELKIRHLL